VGRALILNVDDYEPGLYRRSRILRDAGFDVREATGGREALRLARAEPPDVVVLDVNLPDMSGFEVCRQLKMDSSTASVMVLHLSASRAQATDRISGLEFGADNYLVEPIEADELLASVHALLRMRRAEQAARAAAAEAAERQQEAEAVADVARSINASLDLPTILRQVAEAARTLCRSDAAQVALWDAQTAAMVMRHHVGHPPDPPGGSGTVEPGQGAGRRVLASGRPFRADAGADGAVLAVPIKAGTQVEGFLCVLNHAVRPFGERDEGVLVRLAEHAAVAIRNSRLFAREQAARAEAQAANRTKDEFLATVSHELRTPLTAMLGWLRVLQAAALDDATRARAFDAITRNARAQARLVDDLLDMSQITSGRVPLDIRPVDVRAVVMAAVDGIRPAADSRGLRLEAAVDPAAGFIWGDAARLQQVISNLLANAVKFTPSPGRIDVRAERGPDDVRIRVSDSGQGISPALLPHVFDRFRQGDSTASRQHGGLGLGLAIVRHLVELHGGSVVAQSAGEGRGATFTAILPVGGPEHRPAPDAFQPDAPGDGERDDGPSRLEGVRVLLVDDEADARELVARFLTQAGARVETAASAAAAVAAFHRQPGDVVVADLGMPGEDGYALLRQLRALPSPGPAVPVVALTAFAGPEHRVRALEAGFRAHLPKPIDPDQLVAVIASCLGRADAGRGPG
jgi:signal transduction histidine kinase/DNA-binding response OmpR family regulator